MFLRWKRQNVTRPASWEAGCQHGMPTVRVTPQVLEAYRESGKPKHRVVWTGSSFRLCCVELPQQRIGWWRNVMASVEYKCGSAVTTPAWAAVLAKIAQTIPRPTADEDSVYDEGWMDHTFERQRAAETWDAYARRVWHEAVQNCRTGKPKVKWTWVNIGGSPPSSMLDPCTVLGLPADFTSTQLKDAYRRAAREHHPDRGGDAAQFRKITDAYNTLSNGLQLQR